MEISGLGNINKERKLASVRVIKDIVPHPNADKLELALVDGWQVVVVKDKHKKGEKVVYFEIDSLLPCKECFSFLHASCYASNSWVPDGYGYRIRTAKLRKEISQGLVMGLSELFEEDFNPPVGTDLTEILGVLKWESPISIYTQGMARGNFPSFIPKTDQERVQNIYKDVVGNASLWEMSLKLDGSSMTAYVKSGEVGVCSRNLELKLEDNADNAFVDAFIRYNLEESLKAFYATTKRSIAIQGELMGPKIQGNREEFHKNLFFVYDVYDIDRGTYLSQKERLWIVNNFDLVSVPIIDNIYLMGMPLEDILALADRPSLVHPVAEGVVFKNISNPELSFKAISNKYLLLEK